MSAGSTLRNVAVNRITPLNDRELLIATGGRGVYRMDMDSLVPKPYITADYASHNGMNGDNINDIYVDGGGAKAAEAKTAQGRTSEGGNGGSAASGQETSPETAAVPSSDAGVPADAAPGSQAGTDAIDAQEVQANEQTYEGEDQEMEGGWIEDAAEDGTQ